MGNFTNLKTSAALLPRGGSPCWSCHTVLLLFSWLFRTRAGPVRGADRAAGGRRTSGEKRKNHPCGLVRVPVMALCRCC